MAFKVVKLFRRHAARGVHADAFENVDHGHVSALESARQDRAAVHEDGRHVEAQHRHHDAGQRLVAAGDTDDGVVAVAAHGELDRIGDHLARHERRLHALVTHGDAVGHGDGAEFARRAAALVHAALCRLRLAHQRDVAGGCLVPARHHADEGAMDVLLLEAHGVVVGTMGRARRPLGHVPARKFRLVERLGVHVDPKSSRLRMRMFGCAYMGIPVGIGRRSLRTIAMTYRARQWLAATSACSLVFPYDHAAGPLWRDGGNSAPQSWLVCHI